MRLRDDRGSSSTMGILCAMIVLSGALTAPFLLSQDKRGEGLEYEAYKAEARGVARELVGILGAAQGERLDEAKVVALANDTSAAGYAALRERAGAQREFHLGIEPLLPPLADPSWRPYGLDGVAYLASERPPTLLVSVSASVAVGTRAVNVSALVTNAGTQPAIFSLEMGLGNLVQNTAVLEQERNTRLLAPGESQTVWARFEAVSAWDPSITGARVRAFDAFGAVAKAADGTTLAPIWRSLTSLPTLTTASYQHLFEAAEPYAETGAPIVFEMDHYAAGGSRVVGARGIFSLIGPNGKEWVNQSVSLPALPGSVYRWTCANCTMDGVYVGTIYNDVLTTAHRDLMVYSSLPLFGTSMSRAAAAQQEIDAIRALVEGFDPRTYDAVLAPEGDVFGDRAKNARSVTSNLGRYGTLVVGSDIKQSALTSSAAKTAVREWVERGGRLIVLGSQSGPQEWMTSFWGISLAPDARAPLAADAGAPPLVSPEALDWDGYATGGKAWTLSNASKFTRVLAPGSDPARAALAFSKPGAFGHGTVVLASFTPGAISAPQDEKEARRLMHNLFVHAHTRMYLDHGRPIPRDAVVAAEERLLAASSELFPEGLAVRVRVHVFD